MSLSTIMSPRSPLTSCTQHVYVQSPGKSLHHITPCAFNELPCQMTSVGTRPLPGATRQFPRPSHDSSLPPTRALAPTVVVTWTYTILTQRSASTGSRTISVSRHHQRPRHPAICVSVWSVWIQILDDSWKDGSSLWTRLLTKA